MKPLKKLLFKLNLLKVDNQQARQWIRERDISLIRFGLNWKEPKIRKEILLGILQYGIKDHKINEILLRRIKDDYFSNAEIALQILQKGVYSLKFTADLKDCEKIFNERVRRKNNRGKTYDKYEFQNEGHLFFDRTKMKRLAIVKKQLKKPIRF